MQCNTILITNVMYARVESAYANDDARRGNLNDTYISHSSSTRAVRLNFASCANCVLSCEAVQRVSRYFDKNLIIEKHTIAVIYIYIYIRDICIFQLMQEPGVPRNRLNPPNASRRCICYLNVFDSCINKPNYSPSVT